MEYIECLFVSDRPSGRSESAIRGAEVLGLNDALGHLERRASVGIRHFLLFGVPEHKSIQHACSERSGVRSLLARAKGAFGSDVTLFADVGLSPYQESGQSVICVNGQTAERLSYAAAAELSVAFAESGADYVAPCLSLPRQVGEVKRVLAEHGLSTRVLSYSAKYASSLYGPYRAAIGSDFGLERKSSQTDYRSPECGLRQIEEDIAQGAAMVMVKPAATYLDIIHRAAALATKPLAVYHVSGEYMMAQTAIRAGFLRAEDFFDELHCAFLRAGADYVVGYASEHFRRWRDMNGWEEGT